MNYIQLEASEQLAGKKHLLSYQLNLLNIVKRHSEYRKLCLLELKEKKELKRKISDLHTQLKEIDLVLPKMSQKTETESSNLSPGSKNRQNLEQEIEQIKHKLEMLS